MLIPLKRGADPLSRQVYLWIRHGIMERTMFGSVSLHEILNEDFSVLVIRLPEEENMS